MADSETQQVDVKKLVTEAIIADAREDASARLVALARRRAEAERKAERKAILTTVGVLSIAASLLWF